MQVFTTPAVESRNGPMLRRDLVEQHLFGSKDLHLKHARLLLLSVLAPRHHAEDTMTSYDGHALISEARESCFIPQVCNTCQTSELELLSARTEADRLAWLDLLFNRVSPKDVVRHSPSRSI